MATLTQMLDGMRLFFLSKVAITDKIAKRLYDTIAKERILAIEESPKSERSPRTQWFAEYTDAGELVNRLKGAESGMVFTDVEFRCYAFMPSDARVLLELFFAQFTLNSFAGTWTDSVGFAVTIKGAHWKRESRNTDYDDQARMSVSSCILHVPWLQR